MHNLKQAYEKLGLSSGSSLDDVEKAYEMHLRRTRRVHDPMPISEISEAYRQIKQHEFDQSSSASAIKLAIRCKQSSSCMHLC